MLITPERHRADEFFSEKLVAITGPAVQISYSLAGTSGRLDVMPVIARYFPRYKPFLREMKKLNLDFGPLPKGPYRFDVINKRTQDFVRFTTPPWREGEGTNSRLVPSNLPIDGIRKIVGSNDEPDLVSAEVRLPPNLTSLTDIILTQASKR
ncbi:MAG TPA: hypothetical protein VFI67_03540 [Sphingomicrobium sp.]|nr:hypothetical protein [Sphingomicrobium sp.]